MDSDKYFEIGSVHGLVTGIVTFFGAWGYCTYQYGFLLGFGLGWLASGILGWIVFMLTSLLWLPLDLLIVLFVLIVLNEQNTKPHVSVSPPDANRWSNFKQVQ